MISSGVLSNVFFCINDKLKKNSRENTALGLKISSIEILQLLQSSWKLQLLSITQGQTFGFLFFTLMLLLYLKQVPYYYFFPQNCFSPLDKEFR